MASKKFLVPLGLVSLASDPASGVEGELYYNNVSDGVRLYKNGAWTDLMSAGSLPSGGSTGQILSKSSNTDYAVEWIENYADYTEVVKLKVKNDGTRALYKGEPVHVTGSDGTNVLVGRSSNVTEGSSSKTIGILEENLATNGQGFVVKEGKLGTLDTSTAGAVGDPVWLGVDGALIYGLSNKPSAPAHLVYLGVVTKKNGSTGEIFVQVQNGFEIRELHDVGIGYAETITDNEVLAYDTTSGTWKNQTASEAGLQTVVSGVTDTEIGYLDGVTSSIQTQIDGKISASSSDTLTNKIINLGTGITSIAGYDDISGFFGQSNIAIYQAGLDKGGRINISSVGVITIADPGIGYTNGIVTTSGGTRLIITVGGNVLTGTLAEFNNSLTDANFATITGTETLTNKTLTSPVINGATIGGNLIPSTSGTYDLGSSSSKFKDLYLSGTTLYLDTASMQLHSGNIQFSHSGNTTIIPLGGGSHTLTTRAGTETLTNKTLTSPKINEDVAITATSTELNYVDGVTSAIQTQIDSKSSTSHNHTVDSLSNVVITGTPTDGQALVWDTATSKWINETVSSVGDIDSLTDVAIDGTPADNEVLAYDSGAGGWKNQTATEAGLLTSSDLANYAPLSSPELTGSPLATTATAGDNSTRIATTEFVATSFALKSGPTFTGTVSLPSTTSIGDVSDTEISYLNNLSSNIQDQLDDKPTLVAGVLSESVIPVEIARVDDISNSTTGYVPVGDKGIAGGVATLNSSGYVPSGQLDPTSVAFLSSPTFTGTVVLPSGTSIGTVTSTEIGYLDGVTSSLQTQLDNKLSSSVAASDYLSKASAISDYQPLDGDLTAIAALAGTSGFLKKSGTNTWVLDTNTYLTTSSATSTYLEITTAATTYAPKAEPTFTGTVVLPSTTSIGDVSATEIGYLDGVTSAIQTQISSKASTGHTHSYQDADSDLTAIAGITSGVGLLKRLGPDTWTIDTSAYITGSSPTISTSLIAGTSTFNLINSIATTVNFAGGATTLIMGATDAGATTTIRTPTINTASTSLDLFNTTATTVNFAGASTTFNLGGTPTGTLTATLFGNATTTTKTINIGTGGASGSETNINIGSSTSGATGTVSVYPSTNFVGTVTVPAPTSSGHATTKAYVDALAAGITVKAQVVYVSSTNLNATYANGTSDSSGGLGVGATLTGNVDGALILDGPEVEANQRVLIKDQTDAKHNGIYVVTFAGDGDDPFILTRATDFNGNTSTNGIIKNGAYIFVTSGTTSANDSYVVSLGGTSTTPSGAIKIGTDNIVLAQYSGVPNNISTLGYVTTGTWAATPIDKDYIDVEIARTNDPVFTGHVTVPDPTDDTDATSKQYVDDLIFASLPYLPDIIPLDDLRYEFNDMDSRFIPKFQGEKIAINNPLRLLLTINGIIQTVDFPEYVWQSMLPREGFMVDSDGYIAFSEVPPVGSTFDARLMLGPNVNSIKKGYPFKAVDILLGA